MLIFKNIISVLWIVYDLLLKEAVTKCRHNLVYFGHVLRWALHFTMETFGLYIYSYVWKRCSPLRCGLYSARVQVERLRSCALWFTFSVSDADANSRHSGCQRIRLINLIYIFLLVATSAFCHFSWEEALEGDLILTKNLSACFRTVHSRILKHGSFKCRLRAL